MLRPSSTEIMLPAYMSKWYRTFRIRHAKYAARYSQAVITVSEFSRREVCAYMGVPRTKVFVILSGCPEATLCHGNIGSLLRRYGVVKPYVVTVGRTDKRKYFDSFVLAFVQAKRRFNFPHHLVIAGTHRSGHSDLLSAIRGAAATEFVHLTGYVAPADLPLLYQTADLFAMPSLYERFGFPVLEAMQLGVPTLLAKAGSLPEVGEESSVYVDPRDLDSIATALARLLTDANLREQLSKQGRVQAAKFSWEKTALETLRVYRLVAEGYGRMQS